MAEEDADTGTTPVQQKLRITKPGPCQSCRVRILHYT